ILTDLLQKFDIPTLIEATSITNSDYIILSTTWYTDFTCSNSRNKKKKRKILLYTKISNKD
ncbi:6875_t:CDS:1, partial [Scutellospora calospora]